ncbi:MAG: hypothetical protein QG673_1687 [Pseudomonadota bacterium]|nr:hypothetical protein [Pseudomonadota bacterium]
MQNLINHRTKIIVMEYCKAFFFVAIIMLLFMGTAHAADSTGVADLDKQATAFEQGIKVFAKWGGILSVIVAGALIGFGKAQGQTATIICYSVLCIGFIGAAWGWFSTSFTEGFVF